jgi:hypothetical protein
VLYFPFSDATPKGEVLRRLAKDYIRKAPYEGVEVRYDLIIVDLKQDLQPEGQGRATSGRQGLSANIFAAHSESLRHGAAAVASGSLSADYPVKESSINWLELLGADRPWKWRVRAKLGKR